MYQIFGAYKDEKSISKVQEIKRDHRDLVGESSDIGRHTISSLSRHPPQDRLLGNKFFSSLKEVRFSEPELSASTMILNIKYYHLRS